VQKNKEIEIKLPPKFKGLFKPARYKIYYGGRGGAKSFSFATALIIRAYSQPLRILCTREFQSSIADSVHRLLADRIHDLNLDQWFDVTNTAITSKAGSLFIFKGLRHSIQEIKSTEGIDIVWVEEAQAISQNSWKILIPTIRKEESQIWISFNPEEETDPTYQRFVINTPPNSIIKKVGWEDNPYFPKVLNDERLYMLQVDPEAYEHVWGGDCRQIGDAVIFKNRVSVETFNEPSDDTQLYYGADWGFSNDPTVLIRCWVKDKCLYIDREAYGMGVEIDDLPELFDSIPGARKWNIKADNSRPETISHMQRQGFNISAAPKWQGSIEDGITVMKGFQRIIVHERCQHTAKEFRLYSYKTDRLTEEVLPIIIDKHNHCFIAGTKISTSRGNVPIEDVRVGDFVLTRFGFRKVLFSGVTGVNKKVVSVNIGEKTIVCTPGHKIFINKKGFTFANALRYNDSTITLKENESWLKQQSIREKLTEDIQAATTRQIVLILQDRMQIIKHLLNYIGRYGKTITDQYLSDTISIIKMAILPTMILQTSPAFPHQNTQKSMNGMMPGKDFNENIWTRSDILQRHGIQAQKEKLNIEKLVQLHIKNLFQYPKYANIVNSYSYLRKLGTLIFSALINANQLGAEPLGLTTSQENARYAESNLKQTNIVKPKVVLERVQSVCVVGTAKQVYDLTIEGDHEFFANSILVHNCLDSIRYGISSLIRVGFFAGADLA